MAPRRVKSPSRVLGLIHFLYVTLGMVLYQDALTSPARILRGAPKLKAGDTEITSTISQVILLSGLFVFLWGYRRELIRALRPLLPLLVLLALCFVSVAWSEFPSVTIRRSVTQAICVFFGVFCYFRYGLAKTVEMLAHTTAVLAVLSIVAYFALPDVGRETAEGYSNALRGVYSQKNATGMAMLIASNYWLSAFFGGRKLSFFAICGALATFACLVMSSSATSLGLFCVTGFVHLFNFARRSWRLRVVVTYAVVMIVFVITVALIAAPAELFGLAGRDLSFTGRVPLWIESIDAWLAKPIFGYGFAAFWVDDSVLVQRIWRDITWPAPNAHDGYIDVLLQFGVVGLAVYLWVWATAIFRAVRARRRRNFPEIYWIVGFILTSLFINLDEGGQPSADEFALLLPIVLLALANAPRKIHAAVRRKTVDFDLVEASNQ